MVRLGKNYYLWRIITYRTIINSKKHDMEQIERIKTMELHLDRASQAVMRLSAALDDYAEVQEALRELEAYYGSDWKQDFADDEAGRLPKDLKRGVLSEDGIWNLLNDSRDLNTRMQEIITETQNQDHE